MIGWHNRIAMTKKLSGGKRNVGFIVSSSKEERIFKNILHLMGGNFYVGSSGSGKLMHPMKSTVKIINNHQPFCIAPDGSRGPRYHMKDGIAFLMQKTNTDCLLTTYNIKNRIVLNSWNNMIIPLLFSKGIIMYKLIKNTVRTKGQEAQNQLTKELGKKLIDLTEKSYAYFYHDIIKKAQS